MNSFTSLRIENDGAVHSIVLARPEQFNTITVACAKAVGWRNAVRERDAPFGDYGERKRGADQ
ncbi:hypothetical protein [Piscinibacter sp.]|jgi:hypothetical protein|uniref:hypothetical protein n=1 Tax=Piscinibacter sp. TaxID=1903157 RepID=UPI00355A89BC